MSCPVFKGCHSYGATIDEALSNIREVIDMCIEEEKKEKCPHINRFVGFREMQKPKNDCYRCSAYKPES